MLPLPHHAGSVPLHCTQHAVAFEAANEVIDLSLAYTILFGHEGYDIGGFLTIGQQPGIIGVQLGVAHVVDAYASGSADGQ